MYPPTQPGYKREHLIEFRIDRAYIFPVAKGTHDYVDSPGGDTGTYYAISDGWCVAWIEYEKWEISKSHKHNSSQSKHRMFLTKHDAEGLMARLLMGLPPEDSIDE